VQTLLEAYLDHLAVSRPANSVAPISAETSRTAFYIAEALRHHGLSQAISAFSARGSAIDPSLRDLTRREQDAQRQVDWLIRHAALSRHASVAAFAALRQSSKSRSNRKPFAGFGDPIFTLDRGKTDIGKSTLKAELDIRERGCAVKIRGVRVTAGGALDEETLHSTCLRDLVPLPDTAEEVRSIAQALKAPPETSVFLGADASEARIKAMDLSDRRVIAFATHALLPGDLDGLDQPALALSAPNVTGEAEDGLLTMGEIMTLRLNADWVVLSACDTGSASRAGREALSGLGAAFFYAGSRALLVSLWPVETTSARHLTTGIFARQQANPRLARAQALREAILALMDSPGLTDPSTGNVAASYAHPMFWAPFILVGEGTNKDRSDAP
jgi:CHAT domain-containing protein